MPCFVLHTPLALVQGRCDPLLCLSVKHSLCCPALGASPQPQNQRAVQGYRLPSSFLPAHVQCMMPLRQTPPCIGACISCIIKRMGTTKALHHLLGQLCGGGVGWCGTPDQWKNPKDPTPTLPACALFAHLFIAISRQGTPETRTAVPSTAHGSMRRPRKAAAAAALLW